MENKIYILEDENFKKADDHLESKIDNIENEYDDNFDDSKLRIPKLPLDTIIIDCSPINFVDSIGVKTIQQVLYL